MKHFTVSEFVRSETADRKGINNRLPKELLPNVQALVDNVLDPLREAWGGAIIVNSGYRCEALNKAVGGVSTSDHLKAMAADVTVGGIKENKRLFNLAQELKLPFKQLILEQGGKWVHISYDKSNEKRQILYLP